MNTEEQPTENSAAEKETELTEPVQPVNRKNTQQLDLLLLKAESYSKFILENQQRSQKLLVAQRDIVNSTSKEETTAKQVDQENEPPSSTKKRRSVTPQKSTGNKKRKSLTAPETESSPNTSIESNSSDAAAIDHSLPLLDQPPNLTGGKLMPHQLEGLQWLLSLWENGLNGILADEMGLGKTIQIIALIGHLRHHNTTGPYLIAGPLATLSNWVREFQKWLPSCPVLLYHGTKQEREELRKKHLSISQQKTMNFPIVITSFELCIVDRPFLEKYVWQYIILDEGHRIKNRNCKLLKDLKSFHSISRLLLTGTPIQNSLEELWSLLNFCSPQIFDDLTVFKSWFNFGHGGGADLKIEDIIDEENRDKIITKLHEILRPFVLRRFKQDTIGELISSKREIVIYCSMSRLQIEYYSYVLEDKIRDMLIESGIENAKKISQLNPLMNLRKVANHPFLFGDLTDKHGISIRDSNPELFINASGKFRLLDRLLIRLHSQGHKVILFSQMTEVLNLIEDYLYYRQYSYVRFDGSTKLIERQESIDSFNNPEEDVFIFLLSTRAGGLGINLTGADTVILFDSDWNPHVDSQAQVCYFFLLCLSLVSF
jgi:ATP-dependent DNA helicase